MKKSYYYQVVVKLAMFFGLTINVIAAETDIHLAKQQLIAQAENYIATKLTAESHKTIKVNAMPIDDRIKIPVCHSKLNFSVNNESINQSNITVKAQCNENNWYMFLVIKATEIQPVVVLASAVSPGTLLTESNLRIIQMDTKRLRSTTFSDIDEIVGTRIKRRVPAGRPISPSNLCYVCKGDSVTISAVSEVMHVKTSGIALEDGNMGDTISVKNSRSSKRIKAKVADTGQVEVNI
ncbi:flagellar basal body P-ring formation protein FlgA [Paraglaciecola aquimarina]|uniref:Flagella basal body P-ring formation protein FlgA n=1 Tax=Paraglaciecola algarum TaxID=3050085 RepID=A0ABS9D926_9ALTE|nr:flagellar basal body P-ring formation chaperone FlgA [Paraglaciecola sp. G1-23]MCF2948161.1 flagellar basal body P-ring formation protein FlgA [Paraglaciecola sp. G1-23]